jgi:hypothetical protein
MRDTVMLKRKLLQTTQVPEAQDDCHHKNNRENHPARYRVGQKIRAIERDKVEYQRYHSMDGARYEQPFSGIGVAVIPDTFVAEGFWGTEAIQPVRFDTPQQQRDRQAHEQQSGTDKEQHKTYRYTRHDIFHLTTSVGNNLTSALKADHNPPSPPRWIVVQRKHFHQLLV